MDCEALLHGEVHPAQRRVLTCSVRVEAEEEALRQPAELAQLRLRERRPHRRDDRREARLPEREHVGVPFDDDRAVLLRDRLPRGVEPVQEVALPEEVALGRVHVLRLQRVVVVQLARLEAAHASRARRRAGRRCDARSSRCRAGWRGRPRGARRSRSLRRARVSRASGRRARSRAGTAGTPPARARGSRGTRARGRPGRCPTARARRTWRRARAAARAVRGGGARDPPRARSPRTRAARRSGCARNSIAPTKSTCSSFSTNAIASPPSPQPKHLYVPRAGETVKLGVRSWWNGQRPLYVPPALRRRTKSSTSGRISVAAFTASTDVSLMRAITRTPARTGRSCRRRSRSRPRWCSRGRRRGPRRCDARWRGSARAPAGGRRART